MSRKVTRLPTAAKRRVRNPVAVLDGSEGNVAQGTMSTTLDLPSERILRQAEIAGVQEVVVLGIDQDGEFYFSAANRSTAEILLMLERAKIYLLRSAEE